MITTCQPVNKLFFIFFKLLIRCPGPAAVWVRTIVRSQSGRSRCRLVQHGCLTCCASSSNNCSCSRLDAASPDPIHLRSLEAASPAWTWKQTIVRIHQQVRQAADPIPIIYLLLSPGRTLNPNNCEHSPLEAGLEPDPIPITCTWVRTIIRIGSDQKPDPASRSRSQWKLFGNSVTRRSKCRPRLAHV